MTQPTLVTVEQLREQYQWLRIELSRTEAMLRAIGEPLPDLPGMPLGAQPPTSGRFARVSLADALITILQENGPMGFKPLFQIYERDGGTKAKASAQSTLSRDMRFQVINDKWELTQP